MNAMDDCEDRDLRRRQLAKRLVAHEARTQTIYEFTGYTARRQGRLRQRWGVPPDARRRGPAPTSFAFCFESLRGRAETSCAAVFCSMFGAIPQRPAGGDYANLDTGEHLCEGYEAFRACFPWTSIEFEQFKLIAVGLWAGELLQLDRCVTCSAATLIDLLAKRRRTCPACRRRELAGGAHCAGGNDSNPAGTRGQGELF